MPARCDVMQVIDAKTGEQWFLIGGQKYQSEADALAAERAMMRCSPMQGMLALGEARWAAIQSYRDNEAAWAERVIIDRAGDWLRGSQNIQFFAYLLGMEDHEVDALFRLAASIEA